MALPPLFKRRSAEARDPGPTSDALELQARTRARRRLIGAAVLLVVGIIAFPLLFETQPRPIPVDIPMVIPSRDGAPALVTPTRPSRSASGVVGDAAPVVSAASTAAVPASAAVPSRPVERVAETGPETVAEKAAGKPADRAPEKPVEKAAPRPVEKPADKPAEKAADRTADTKAAPKAGRFVVQVGAYNDESSAREARAKVEKLGLKTYTQAVEVGGVKRIRVRVGPFETNEDANKAAAALRAAKLTAAVLTL